KGGGVLDWFFLAMTHWQLGNKDRARACYTAALAWMVRPGGWSVWPAPDDKELRRFRKEAAALLQLPEHLPPIAPKTPRDAVHSWSLIIEDHPKVDWAYSRRGEAYADLKQWDKAIADYSEAIKLNPNSAGLWNQRGLAYGNSGQWEKQIEDVSQAIK